VARGGAGYAEVDDSALTDPVIAGLRHRVHVSADPALTAKLPALRPARVTLKLKDGRQATHECDSPRGDCLNPYTEAEIRAKFRELAGAALTPQGLDEVEQAVGRLEHWKDTGELTGPLRRHSRPVWK
jgi:2-methylcitrate dehydratase PrpD